MGKLKKRQRIEKAKVKLKKKQLSKAQNVTDTSFKIRKIIIPTQLKEVPVNEPVSKRKLNVKELTSRLKHHNDTARQGALAGLREVLSQNTDEVLTPHLLIMAQALVEMIVVEVNTKLRRDALKLLDAILSQVSVEKIAPFFKVLLWHLTCAMTHINARIQEDSLFLFDILLACAPSLMVSAVSDVLPSFLNMISRLCAESRPGRTLTLDLGSKLTSVHWRVEVLARVRSFLAVVVGSKEQQETTTAMTSGPRVYHWSRDGPLYAPAYHPHPLPPCELLGVFHRTITESSQGETVDTRSYAKELMPLLFETWLEVRPSITVDHKGQLNQEASQLVMTVVDITQLMYNFMSLGEHEDAKCKELRDWFAETYRENFIRYIVVDFPFSQAERAVPKKHNEQLEGRGDASTANMVLANLTVCYLFLVLNTAHSGPAAAKVSKFIKRSVGQWRVLDERCRDQLLRVLRCALLDKRYAGSIDSHAVMRALTAACLKQPDEKRLFQLLCELSNRHNDPDSAEVLSPWLAKLPQLLCLPEVSGPVVESLSHLACQRVPAFWDAFIASLPQFIKNLGAVKVSGDGADGRLRLAGLLYWVPSWSGKLVSLLQHESKGWDPSLTRYVSQLVDRS